MALPGIRRLVASLLQGKPGFISRSVHVRFLVGKEQGGRSFSQHFNFPLAVSLNTNSMLVHSCVTDAI